MVRFLTAEKMETILLIEDTNALIENLTEYLEMEGYEILLAKDGKVGIDIARKALPDLIICDIQMPEMDGYEVLRELKSTAKTSVIPVIITSSLAEEEDKEKAFELGADEYILKPFELETLLEVIKICMVNDSKKAGKSSHNNYIKKE